jgi:hypothetical protein
MTIKIEWAKATHTVGDKWAIDAGEDGNYDVVPDDFIYEYLLYVHSLGVGAQNPDMVFVYTVRSPDNEVSLPDVTDVLERLEKEERIFKIYFRNKKTGRPKVLFCVPDAVSVLASLYEPWQVRTSDESAT